MDNKFNYIIITSIPKVDDYWIDCLYQMKELIGLNQSIEGRHIVILEDIVDTGRTLDFILKTLEIHKPASISVSTLLHKPEATVIPISLDYVGFEIQNQFVVGYGLDYNGFGRNSSSILIKVDD